MKLSKRIYGNELEYIKEVLETEFRSSKGAQMMQRLEKKFAEKFDTEYAIAHVNGTATMHTILEAANIGFGDEVIVPPLTMSSTTFAVLHANATPVFADVFMDSFLINPEEIRKKITSKTRAIITVSLFGLSPKMDEIMDIANEYKLIVIEDNAECLLGTYKGKKVGTFGHASSYSFQSSKHITSGEGGMVITNSLDLANGVRRANSLGYAGVGASKGKITKQTIQDPSYSRHISMGWNYRMPELCAAVVLAQLENVEELVERRIEVANLFNSVIKDTDWLSVQTADYEHEHTYWTFVVRINHPSISWNQFRDKFISYGGHGIYAPWKLTYMEPMFEQMNLLGREKFISDSNKSQYKVGLCPNAEILQKSLLCFKTNYWDFEDAIKQATILENTIKFFNDGM
jgi:perosamine synthetase